MAQPRSMVNIPPVAPPAPSYPTQSDCSKFMPPARWEKAPGVLTDGKRTVYSAALPEVQRILQEARETLVAPSLSSEVIFTLAALAVFYHPSDPAHWTFWSDEKKNQTADIVNRIALRQPPLIQAPVAWNGKVEYLAVLGRVHSGGWQKLYEDKDWYRVLVPPKPTTPPRSLSLRKRKAAPGALREPSPLIEEETDDAPSKPTERAATPEKRYTRAARSAKEKAQVTIESPAPASAISLAAPASVVDTEDILTPLSDDLDLPSEPIPSPAPLSRKKRKISPPSSTHFSDHLLLSMQQESPFPIHASLLLGPGVIPPSEEQLHAHIHTHARTRSTSSETSVDTLVQSNAFASRSSSVSDSGTAIEMVASSLSLGKRKAAASVDLDDAEEEGTDTRGDVAAAVVKKPSKARSKRSKKATFDTNHTKAKASLPTKRKARKA